MSAAPSPDFSTMSRAELTAWKGAIDAAIAAAEAAGGGGDDLDVAILADDEGVSVTFTIPLSPSQS